jgi:hypothetical protein
MAVLFLTANRLQMRAWPFLVFGPTMLVAFLVMMIFVTSSLAIVAATAVIGIAGAVSMTAILALPPFLSAPADVPRTAAAVGPDRQTVDRLSYGYEPIGRFLTLPMTPASSNASFAAVSYGGIPRLGQPFRIIQRRVPRDVTSIISNWDWPFARYGKAAY